MNGEIGNMKVFITGGCGFIGCNVTQRLLGLGHDITVLDNLSRPGTNENLAYLRKKGGLKFFKADIRDASRVQDVIKQGNFDVIIHLAGQVAVTTSVQAPRSDFEINTIGTVNVLEAVRLHSPHSVLLFSSTNKVYGKLGNPHMVEELARYSLPALPNGINEEQHLDFYSPYGCSKGAADQYVTDYARIYGLRTVSFRQSCIYGCHQLGIEDQGWVAWFIIAHMLGSPITIYGTGKQVRDILFVEDLIDCYLAAIERIDQVAGLTFNVGGGIANTVSLLELLQLLEHLSGRPVAYNFSDWRPGDQPVYISDIRRAKSLLGWQPRTSVAEGMKQLYSWAQENQALLKKAVGHP